MGSGFSFVYKCILIISALNFCKLSYISLMGDCRKAKKNVKPSTTPPPAAMSELYAQWCMYAVASSVFASSFLYYLISTVSTDKLNICPFD